MTQTRLTELMTGQTFDQPAAAQPGDRLRLQAGPPPHRLACDDHGAAFRLNIDDGLAATIAWYRENESWWRPFKDATEAKYASQQVVAAPADTATGQGA